MGKRHIILILTVFILFIVSFSTAVEQTTYQNSIGMEFILIPAGTFMMGSPDTEDTRKKSLGIRGCASTKQNPSNALENLNYNERPYHQVTISKPFFIGKYEVTQEQWVKIMGKNPSEFQALERPVENVSWNDIQIFITKLNQMEGRSDKYRLPTEAEWEYAARAGSETAYHYSDDPDEKQLYEYALYNKNAGIKTKKVGSLKPNAWGLYDMHGNVWEWCQDWYAHDYYSSSPPTDPQGPISGSFRVARGGCWLSTGRNCRSAFRFNYSPNARYYSCGFRLVFSPTE